MAVNRVMISIVLIFFPSLDITVYSIFITHPFKRLFFQQTDPTILMEEQLIRSQSTKFHV